MSTNNNAQHVPATPSTPGARPATVAATQPVTQAPTNQELFDMLNQLREENAQLHAQLNANRAPAGPRAKYPEPEPYDGTPGLLQGFLTRTCAYLRYYVNSFPTEADKVHYAASFLKKDAFAWFEPTMRDHLENTHNNQDDETQAIFSNYDEFEKRLKSTFGNPDEERIAERKLMNLTQKGSASKDGSEFRQITSKLEWGDEALIAKFYQGLKEDVKDELARTDRPDELHLFIDMAVKIDNRLYERRLERKGHQPWTHKKSTTGRKYTPITTATGYHSGPMDLSAAIRGNDNKTRNFKTYRGNKPWSNECFNCNKPGHIARNCDQPKKPRWQPVPEKVRQVNATSKAPHEAMPWTGCYDDGCRTH
ncbi:reverse transcriptase domain protein [Colletotrichum sojae]|uniref:Reverse transcriptase domain protein n=1 Tax=Colletotrichum sojae TaxID=2175907 RepID=A0A8H6J4D5_9PEZI|nr:reverse transcriptase domain protein [Colletotrichum sojae]